MFNHLAVEFPTYEKAPLRISSCKLVQSRYQHDMAFITFMDWDLSYDMLKPGTPMVLTIKTPENHKKHFGYVHHFTKEQKPGGNVARVAMIGCSYVFKQASQEIHKNITADAIVKKIARSAGFSYDIQPHKRVYPQVAKAGHTDWEIMTRLAKQSGYILRADNTALHFKPVTEDFELGKSTAPSFVLTSAQSPAKSTIFEFIPAYGDSFMHEDGSYKAASAVQSFNHFTGQSTKTFKTSNKKSLKSRYQPALFDKYKTSVVAHDDDTAKYELEGVAESNRYPYRAKAVLKGHPLVYPGSPVYLKGIDPVSDGFWTVLSVEHIVKEGIYTLEVELGTDSISEDDNDYLEPSSSGKLKIIPGKSFITISDDPVLSTRAYQLKPRKTVKLHKLKHLSDTSTDYTESLWRGSGKNLRNYGPTKTKKVEYVLTGKA